MLSLSFSRTRAPIRSVRLLPESNLIRSMTPTVGRHVCCFSHFYKRSSFIFDILAPLAIPHVKRQFA